MPSSSLIPDDPSVLLTTAGMQQFKPYFSGQLDPKTTIHPNLGEPVGLNVASIQKSFRTSDIDEVGDESHLTFFEMLGNFSFGGYFKEHSIKYAYEFITSEDWMNLEIDYVTVFDPERVPDGDWRKGVPFDKESYDIWKNIIQLPESKIKKEGVDNFWGPTGREGPCGPTTEIYVKNIAGKAIEIWNIVFNEYYCYQDKSLVPIESRGAVKGVDTGMGLERLAMIVEKKPTIFDVDLFAGLMPDNLSSVMDARIRRIVLDHCRGIAFLISDGVRPSNKDQGYILRRLIRRSVAHFYQAARGSFAGGDIWEEDFLDMEKILINTAKNYKDFYPNLDQEAILKVFREENSRFRKAIINGLREIKKLEKIDAKSGFKLYETYGLTYEVIKDFAGDKAVSLTREEFDKEFEKHQEISRVGQEKKFGGHGLILDTGELKAASEEEVKIVTRLHTATHMLQQALREVLGPEVRQAGSDITAKRTRFDFTFPRKLTSDEIKKVEEIVNQKIKENLPMRYVELPIEEAKKTGALYFFKEKYPEKVKVYFMGNSLDNAWSKEFCGGPHVTYSGEVGRFKITKEEAVGAGVRRIRGVVE